MPESLFCPLEEYDTLDVICIRKEVGAKAFDGDEWRRIPLLLDHAVAEELHIPHLSHRIARDVHEAIEALARAQGPQNVTVESASGRIDYANNLALGVRESLRDVRHRLLGSACEVLAPIGLD